MTSYMSIMRHILIAVVILVLMPFWLSPFLRLFGIYVDEAGWYVAKIAVEQGKSVNTCHRIITTPWNFLSPPTTSLRMDCIHEYAKLTHDPSACELIMPSEYGLSCINDVISQEYENHMESGFFEWEECSKPQSDPLRLDWCDFLRAHRNRSAADCSPIRNEIIRTGCTLKFEAWEQYPELRSSFYFGKATQ